MKDHCQSCGTYWRDHLGIVGTCAELQSERMRYRHDMAARTKERDDAIARAIKAEDRASELHQMAEDAFGQLAIYFDDQPGDWMGGGALSTCEDLAEYLVSVGRLEQHQTKRWYRWRK